MSEDKEDETTPSSKWSTKNPFQWEDLLHATSKIDGTPAWPSISNVIPNMICEACSFNFVSAINYRRHLRSHDPKYKRTQETAEAEKRSLEECLTSLSKNDLKQVVSLQGVRLNAEVSGLTIDQKLKSFIQKPKVILPEAYRKAGAMLLDIVQPYQQKDGCPVNVKKLFEILIDASEGTFFCTVIDYSAQKFVFEEDGEVDDNDLVACACFLLEQKMVGFGVAESLIKEEENQKISWKLSKAINPTMQQVLKDRTLGFDCLPFSKSPAKPKANIKKKKLKKNIANTRKQNEDPTVTKEGDEDALKLPTETPTHGSLPYEDDSSDQVAQPDQLLKATMPFDVDKADNRGCGQKEADIKIIQDNVSTEYPQKDAELWKKEQDVEKQPTRLSKAKIKNMKKAERKAQKKNDKKRKSLGNKLETPQLTGLSTPDATSKEQKSQDAIDTSDPFPKENEVTQRNKLPGDKEDGGLKQKPDVGQVLGRDAIKEQESEDKGVKDVTSSSGPSGSLIDTQNSQPNQSSSLLKQVVVSNAKKDASKEQKSHDCQVIRNKRDTSDPFPKENKVTQLDKLPGDKEDGGLKQKSDVGQVIARYTRKEQESEAKDVKDVTSSSGPSESPIVTQNTKPDQPSSNREQVVVSDTKKSAEAIHSQERPQTKELQGRLENMKEDYPSSGLKKCNKVKYAIASLADDPDSIRGVKEDIDQAWQKMLSSLQNLHTRNRPR